jgi:lipopolysaccharide biosynthesis glycosyltransferase
MNIIYASDNNGIELLLVSMYSVIKNHKDAKIFVLQSDLTEHNKSLIKQLAKGRAELEIVDIDVKRFTGVKITTERLPLQTFYRMLAPELLRKQDKALWIDIDTLCVGSLSDMYKINLDKFWVGGALDPGMSILPEFYSWYKKFNSTDVYINAGVLLMNLEKMRQDSMVQKLIDMAVKQNKLFGEFDLFGDQTAINVVLKEGIKLLPRKYNSMVGFTADGSKEPKVLHFSGYYKPFMHYNTKIKYADLYWQYYDELLGILPVFDYKSLIKKSFLELFSRMDARISELDKAREEILSRIPVLEDRIAVEVAELRIYRDEPSLQTVGKLLRRAVVIKLRQTAFKAKRRLKST